MTTPPDASWTRCHFLARGLGRGTVGALADETVKPIEVPYTELSPAALRGLIEEFVTRDGTDYGVAERSVEAKVEQVRGFLERGEARVVFDPETGTANIVVAV